MQTSFVILVLSAVVAAVMADGEYAPPAYEKKYDGYFQYANVPGKDEYEFGYNRGNPSHSRNHYEQSKDHRFRRKVKWNDAYSGNGEHYWEYNHGDAGYAAPAYPAAHHADAGYKSDYAAPAYPAQENSASDYSAPFPTYQEAPSAKL